MDDDDIEPIVTFGSGALPHFEPGERARPIVAVIASIGILIMTMIWEIVLFSH